MLESSRLFFFQAEDGIRDLVRSRGLGDVYKRQEMIPEMVRHVLLLKNLRAAAPIDFKNGPFPESYSLVWDK